MIKVSVSELTGAALDWAVATCEELPVRHDPMGFGSGPESGYWVWDESQSVDNPYQLIGRGYTPSTSWAQAGPMFEANDIFPTVYYGCAENNPNKYQANKGPHYSRGETPLVAAMRVLVMSKMGDEVDVPSYFQSLIDVKQSISDSYTNEQSL